LQLQAFWTPNSDLRPIVSFKKGKGIQSHIEKIYDDKTKAFPTIVFSNKDCTKPLLEYVNIYPQTTPVLDAFDECDREKTGTLLQTFDDLIKPSLKPVKFYI
jgi:hypothetical protein